MDVYTITSVDVGINQANAAGPTQPVTVNLYTSSNFPTGFPASLTLIGTTTVNVADQTNTVLNVPISAVVPAGTAQIVVEVTNPDGTGLGNVFIIGSNDGAETGPSYLSAPLCGLTAPATTASLGFPDVHWVLNINGSCPMPTATPTPAGSITGTITYALSAATKPVPDAILDAPGSIPVAGTTDVNGNYILAGFGTGPYTVTPSKAAQPCGTSNGIFANDAGLVSRHVVGIITLSDAQIAAAKVSGDASPQLTSFDAGLIAQKIVGICSMANLSGQWRFTPASVSHPGGVSTNLVENYTSYLMGDVTGDWNPALNPRPTNTTPTENAVAASVPSMKAAPGSVISIPFRIDNLQDKQIDSYQFDIAFDPAVLAPSDISASVAGTLSDGLSVVSNSPQPGLLKAVVYGSQPISGDGVYIDLKFTVIGNTGSATPLSIVGFRFNDGTDEIISIGGKLIVSTSDSKEVNNAGWSLITRSRKPQKMFVLSESPLMYFGPLLSSPSR
jgi:hypothetical protein